MDAKMRSKVFLDHLLSFKFRAHHGEDALVLKLATPTDGVHQSVMDTIKNRIAELKKSEPLYYLNASYPIPADLVKVTVNVEDEVIVELAGQLWYLVLRLLADHKVDEADQHGNTLLHVAIESQQQNVVELLVDSGASLEVKNKDGQSPYSLWERQAKKKKKKRSKLPHFGQLHDACTLGNLNDVRRLLCTVGTVEDYHEMHGTPLHAACKEGHETVVLELLKIGAQVNAVNKGMKATPLHVACREGKLNTCRHLVAYGANVNQQADCRRTALHVACMKGHLEIVVPCGERC
jgi:ankyrin repeat protein